LRHFCGATESGGLLSASNDSAENAPATRADGVPIGPQSGRSLIVIRQELRALTDEALSALRSGSELFVRARLLVQLGRADGLEDPASRLTRPLGAPIIIPLSKPALLDRLDVAAQWARIDGHGNLVPARPPSWVSEQILARLAWPFPPLEGVVATPVLRPDGTVLTTPGYDVATGLFYQPAARFPGIPASPTRSDAESAIRTLLEPVQDFPFTDFSGRAAYIGALLSLAGRYAIDGPVPGFPISSPTPGTGKGLLAAVISLIGTGRSAAIMSQSWENEEFRKRVLALALSGTPLILLDNLSGVLGSDVLAAALTATEWEDRLLGFSKVVRAPLRAVWLFTGNNLSFKKTLGRRMVPIYLDALVEHPEDRRDFVVPDLLSWVLMARPALVSATLTVLRFHCVGGRPRHEGPRMGSFEAWDDLVRGACMGLGLADPAQANDPLIGRGRIRAELDEDVQVLSSLLCALNDVFGEQAFLTAEVAARAKTDDVLRSALEASGAVDRKGQITPTTIGYRFRAVQDRIVEGKRLLKDRTDRHQKKGLWRVATSAQAGNAGNAGDAGDVSASARSEAPPPRVKDPELSPASSASPAGPAERYGF
jgi:hypothetical protein